MKFMLLLKQIDDVEDEEDLIAAKAREDICLDGTVTWKEVQNEISEDVV